MAKKQIIRLINEEISNFDFLGLDEIKQEDSIESVLKSRDFQVRFVNDVLRNFNDGTIFKDKEEIEQSSNVEDLQPDGYEKLNVTYIIDFKYNYQGKDMPLSIIIEGNNVWYDLQVTNDPGDWYTPPSGEASLDIDWNDFGVKIMYDGEIEVELDWLYKNKELYKKFVQMFIGNLVSV
jgi:hypothetical protein